MLPLTPGKNRQHNEHNAQLVMENITEYEIDNRNVYIILDQSCGDTDLFSYVKQNKSKRDG